MLAFSFGGPVNSLEVRFRGIRKFFCPDNALKFGKGFKIWILKLLNIWIATQWRREDFGSGRGHLVTKRLSRAPEGGPGAKAHRMVAKFFFNFKTSQSIRKWIYFSKISTFFLTEKSIFSTKTFEKLNKFYRNFLIFSKNNFTISSFNEHPLNPAKFPLNSII